ncbi:ribonuclease 3 [Kordiimonas sediminis]|uniref:Ribonuclease 3 n=1 Tax=Kordiimonas sediminis TaxID=1735581 RepID=A0A919AZ41_9PROT|nr:ribonuclease III [Kordiimonas sediminis]GHF29656.1 ribonuclease 3 [Kordiimonas sediminis]
MAANSSKSSRLKKAPRQATSNDRLVRKKSSGQDLIGYSFKNEALLSEALSHPSLSGRENYQRLEFLGDRVLGLVISTWLFEKFPAEAEGQLNRRFIALVRKETLAEVARELGLVDVIKMTPGARKEGAHTKDAVQADVCEAVIGAMYLDGGLEVARAFIKKHWESRVGEEEATAKDFKTRLQEFAQGRGLALPTYKQTGRKGPDHSPIFTISVTVEGHGEAEGQGTSKRIAEQAAADMLLQKLATKGQSK